MLEMACPHCQSMNYRVDQIYKTLNNGDRKLLFCRDCEHSFSETKGSPAAHLNTSLAKISEVLKARSEGIGFNACARTFNISRQTLRNWENRFASLQKVLFLYSLCHQFLEQTIEGDEIYTKVGSNRKACESEGWTIILMERASRFIWHMECGKRDQKLFKRAISYFVDIFDRTGQMTLITDGEKRYGTTLFDACSKAIKTKRPGRPKKLYHRECA